MVTAEKCMAVFPSWLDKNLKLRGRLKRCPQKRGTNLIWAALVSMRITRSFCVGRWARVQTIFRPHGHHWKCPKAEWNLCAADITTPTVVALRASLAGRRKLDVKNDRLRPFGSGRRYENSQFLSHICLRPGVPQRPDAYCFDLIFHFSFKHR
jgi:hypothetical protein